MIIEKIISNLKLNPMYIRNLKVSCEGDLILYDSIEAILYSIGCDYKEFNELVYFKNLNNYNNKKVSFEKLEIYFIHDNSFNIVKFDNAKNSRYKIISKRLNEIESFYLDIDTDKTDAVLDILFKDGYKIVMNVDEENVLTNKKKFYIQSILSIYNALKK